MASKRRLRDSLWRGLPWLWLAALGLLQGLALPGDYLGREHDDAQYVLAARSLTRGTYRLGITPGDPPLTVITPGWPLLLTPAAVVSGDAAWGYHLTAWLWLVAADALFWLWLKRRLPGREAALGTALFGLCPLILARAGSVMTEVPATALTLALFLCLDSPGWPAWGSGLMLAFLWLVRQATVALFPAVAAVYLLRRRWKDAAWCLAIPLATLWFWNRWIDSAGSVMPEAVELSASYVAGWRDVPAVFGANAYYYASLLGSLWLPWPARVDPWRAALGAALLCLSARGALRRLRRSGYDAGLGWLGFGLLMHAFWPYSYERYLLPFVPFLLWTIMVAAASPSTAAAPVLPSRALAAVAAALFVCFIGQGRRWLFPGPERTRPELHDTYSWIRDNTPGYCAFASLFYARDALYAVRPFAPMPNPARPEELAALLRKSRIRYVLAQEPGDVGSAVGPRFTYARMAGALLQAFRQAPFREVYSNPVEGTVIYSVPL